MAVAVVTKIDKIVHPFDKANLEALLSRRFFYAPAFEIYGGTNAFSGPSRLSGTNSDISQHPHINQVSPVYMITAPLVHLSRLT